MIQGTNKTIFFVLILAATLVPSEAHSMFRFCSSDTTIDHGAVFAPQPQGHARINVTTHHHAPEAPRAQKRSSAKVVPLDRSPIVSPRNIRAASPLSLDERVPVARFPTLSPSPRRGRALQRTSDVARAAGHRDPSPIIFSPATRETRRSLRDRSRQSVHFADTETFIPSFAQRPAEVLTFDDSAFLSPSEVARREAKARAATRRLSAPERPRVAHAVAGTGESSDAAWSLTSLDDALSPSLLPGRTITSPARRSARKDASEKRFATHAAKEDTLGEELESFHQRFAFATATLSKLIRTKTEESLNKLVDEIRGNAEAVLRTETGTLEAQFAKEDLSLLAELEWHHRSPLAKQISILKEFYKYVKVEAQRQHSNRSLMRFITRV